MTVHMNIKKSSCILQFLIHKLSEIYVNSMYVHMLSSSLLIHSDLFLSYLSNDKTYLLTPSDKTKHACTLTMIYRIDGHSSCEHPTSNSTQSALLRQLMVGGEKL